MFDTMIITKVVGAVCGVFLVYLLIGWGSQAIYYPAHATVENHGESIKQAYTIEVEEEAAAATTEIEDDFMTLYASADAAKGEKAFNKCRACHKLDGQNAIGPYLNDVVDRQIASVEGFKYSDALINMDSQKWTPENLSSFIENPKAFAPGTKMNFKGLSNAGERADLIAFLATQHN